MVAFGHTGVGAIVGVTAYQILGKGDIALGLIAAGFLGVLSHYLMDLIPHGHFFRSMKNYDKYIIWIIIFDLLVPFLFLLGLAHSVNRSGTEILYMLFGIGGAQLPDIMDGLKRIRLLPKIKILELENKFHMATHWHGKEEKALLFSYYDIWQIAVFGVAVLTVLYY